MSYDYNSRSRSPHDVGNSRQQTRHKPVRSNKAASAAILPYGSRSHYNSPAELADWPLNLVRLLLDGPAGGERKKRLETMFASGPELSSFFSGKFCAEVAILTLCVAFKQLGISVPQVPVVLWRGCDICGLSQRMARS